ncbi:MAG TPA: glycosyltransferase family 2 protein [Thermoanaerobaculia bacterium]|nr:glycosyltransferase family 2 protein [Thermoanaerobaculia bacterium]
MLLSVVTPSYQQGRFLERTLESVWAQNRGSLAGAIEHIVMDGGSTDGTLEILSRWNGRISFTSERDGGQAAAINAGLARASGEILAYLNSDDVYYRDAAAAAVAAFERDPSADVVYGDAELIDDADRCIGHYPTEDWSIERLKVFCFLCQPAVFFRRRVFEQFGPFDARLAYSMDYEYWLRLGMRGVRFVHIPVRLAASRVHPATKTRRRPAEAVEETNTMLEKYLGRVPDSWLWNYAYAVQDQRGIARTSSLGYLTRVALLSIGAAFRWNGYPSISLVRTLASWLVRGSSTVRPQAIDHA